MFKSCTVRVEPTDKDGIFRTCTPVIFESKELGRTITVPVGFETDGASVPWYLQWLFEESGKKYQAAIVHDYLYRNKLCTRAQADAVFREALVVLGVPSWQVFCFYKSVRIFGGLHYGG